MSESITWTCDCGCGKTATGFQEQEGWIVALQYSRDEESSGLKIRDDRHFASIACLAKWSSGLTDAYEKVFSQTAGMEYLGGEFQIPGYPGVYV